MSILTTVLFIGVVIYVYFRGVTEDMARDPENAKSTYWTYLVIIGVLVFIALSKCLSS